MLGNTISESRRHRRYWVATASEEGYAEEDTRKRMGCGMKTIDTEAIIRSTLQPRLHHVAWYFPIQTVSLLVPDIKETSVPKSSPPTFLSNLHHQSRRTSKSWLEVICFFSLRLQPAQPCMQLHQKGSWGYLPRALPRREAFQAPAL